MNQDRMRLYFLGGLCIVSALLAFFIFQPFLATLSLAAVFSVVLAPVYRFLAKVSGRRMALAALATVVLAAICILIPLIFVSVQLFIEAQSVYSAYLAGGDTVLRESIQSIGVWLAHYIPGASYIAPDIAIDISGYARQGLEWLVIHVGPAFSGIANIFLGLFIFFISLYYFLKDGEKFKKAFADFSPMDDADGKIVFLRLERAINSIVRGSLVIALIQGTLTSIGFTVFGIPNSVLWGLVTSFAALVPGVGTSLVIVPGILYLLATGHIISAIGLTLWGTLAVGLIDNFLSPLLIGRGMRMHPLLVFLSVVGGINFFGPAGIFLGPLVLALLFAVFSLFAGGSALRRNKIEPMA